MDEAAGKKYRALPGWAWLLAVLTWPLGGFIALAVAGVIRWWPAVVLSILFYVPVPLAAPHLDASDPRGSLPWVMLMFTWMIALGAVQYWLGKRHGYWSRQARRIWTAFAVLAGVLYVLDGLVTVLLWVLPVRRP